jgi:hypothetical protein
MAALSFAACRPSSTAADGKPRYVVLSQQVLEGEMVFEVDAPDAPKTSRAVLLEIAQSLHDTGEKRERTLVIFRDPRKAQLGTPSTPLVFDERVGNAFAVALVEPARGIKEVRFGVFN